MSEILIDLSLPSINTIIHNSIGCFDSHCVSSATSLSSVFILLVLVCDCLLCDHLLSAGSLQVCNEYGTRHIFGYISEKTGRMDGEWGKSDPI